MTGITLDGISKHHGETQVLKGLSLTVKDGEFLTLVGPSGCGKSTLLKLIAGLDTPTGGQIKIGDVRVEQSPPSARNIAMVFQSYALYPHLSVEGNISVPLEMRWLTAWQRFPFIGRFLPGAASCRQNIKDKAQEVATSLGLESLLDRKPGQLSGGQRQRVALARAMVREPAAFLFDEPLSNLDAKLRVEMRAEISQLHQQLGTTFIYVTHDQAEAMTMSDRIAVMMEGEIVQIGSPDDLYHQPQDIRVARFIGSPPMNLLKAEIVSNTLMLLNQQSRIVNELSNGHVQVGIRSEDIFLVESIEHPKPDFITHGIITHIENLGAEYYLTLNNEDSHHSPITLRLPYQQAKGKQRGQRVHVGFMLSHCHVFNEQGKRTDVHQTPLEVVHG